jgi:hypothetical protein
VKGEGILQVSLFWLVVAKTRPTKMAVAAYASSHLKSASEAHGVIPGSKLSGSYENLGPFGISRENA